MKNMNLLSDYLKNSNLLLFVMYIFKLNTRFNFVTNTSIGKINIRV